MLCLSADVRIYCAWVGSHVKGEEYIVGSCSTEINQPQLVLATSASILHLNEQSHRSESNREPVTYEATALPIELRWRGNHSATVGMIARMGLIVKHVVGRKCVSESGQRWQSVVTGWNEMSPWAVLSLRPLGQPDGMVSERP